MMRMSMSLRPMLRFGCVTCGGYHDEHVLGCPEELIEEALAREPKYGCPKCGGNASVDMDDVIQCRACRTRFSRCVGKVDDPENPEKTIIRQVGPTDDRPLDDEFIEVVVLRRGEERPFKIDVVLAALREDQKKWRAKLRAEKAAARAPQRRHSKAAPCPICGPLYCRYAP